MRVLIVSDTHGRHTSLDRALKEAGEIDMFIHLGDVEGGEDYIEAVVECEKHMIRGNNDFFSYLPAEEEFWIGKKKCLLLMDTVIMFQWRQSRFGRKGLQEMRTLLCSVTPIVRILKKETGLLC